jgi:hypothetical protein
VHTSGDFDPIFNRKDIQIHFLQRKSTQVGKPGGTPQNFRQDPANVSVSIPASFEL